MAKHQSQYPAQTRAGPREWTIVSAVEDLQTVAPLTGPGGVVEFVDLQGAPIHLPVGSEAVTRSFGEGDPNALSGSLSNRAVAQTAAGISFPLNDGLWRLGSNADGELERVLGDPGQVTMQANAVVLDTSGPANEVAVQLPFIFRRPAYVQCRVAVQYPLVTSGSFAGVRVLRTPATPGNETGVGAMVDHDAAANEHANVVDWLGGVPTVNASGATAAPFSDVGVSANLAMGNGGMFCSCVAVEWDQPAPAQLVRAALTNVAGGGLDWDGVETYVVQLFARSAGGLDIVVADFSGIQVAELLGVLP